MISVANAGEMTKRAECYPHRPIRALNLLITGQLRFLSKFFLQNW
jgi:hypothetical protein